MKGVILAGGYDPRLKPLTSILPKPMIPVGDVPVMSYALRGLKRANIHQIAVSLDYMPEKIMNYFGDGADHEVSLEYYIDRSSFGTGARVKQAEGFLDDTFVVVSGEGISNFDLKKALAFHRKKRAIATIVLTEMEEQSSYGLVQVNERGRVKGFFEGPDAPPCINPAVNTGIYIFEPEIFPWIPKDPSFDLQRDLFPLLLKERLPFYGVSLPGYWSELGSMKQLLAAQREVKQGMLNTGAFPFPKFAISSYRIFPRVVAG